MLGAQGLDDHTLPDEPPAQIRGAQRRFRRAGVAGAGHEGHDNRRAPGLCGFTAQSGALTLEACSAAARNRVARLPSAPRPGRPPATRSNHGRETPLILSAVRRLPSLLRSLLAVAVIGATVGASAADANPSAAGGLCPVGSESQPFAAWGDSASYELAPGGDFESAGWALDGGAALVAGSEPFAATGSLGAQSVSLPAGASVTSPSMCLDASTPTLRFFTADGGSVRVAIQAGAVTVPIGVVTASSAWAPSPILLIGASLLGPLKGGTVPAHIVLSGLTGDPRVDDVFVDPWNRG